MVEDPSITAIDSNLLKAKGHVWHTLSMKKGIVARSPGIDTDARWGGYSHTKEGWIFGYKLYLITSTTTAGDLVVPLTADITTAILSSKSAK